jgi:hypothetical protein
VVALGFDAESISKVGVDDSVDRGRELGAPFPAGEQVDVLAGPHEQASRLDGIAARECEAVSLGGGEPSPCEPLVERVHG